MFCPGCGTKNLLDQKYCRQCGHQLAAHRMALEGALDESITKLKKGEDLVGIGLIVLGICAINLIITWAIGAGKFGIVINAFTALLIALPLILIGLYRIDRARRRMDPAEQAKRQALENTTQPSLKLNAAPVTDRSISAAAPSVTEDTTLSLNPPGRAQLPPKERA
jgi:uncharacterized protein YejL (UPF0352 family)